MIEKPETEELQRRNRELAALNAIALATSRSLNLEEMLDFSVAKTLEIFGGEAGCVLLVEATSRRLGVWGRRGLSPELAERFAALALDGEYWQQEAFLDVTNLWRIGEAVKDVARESGLPACTLLPLRWRDAALGVMLLTGGKEALGRWSMEFLMTVSDQLSVAVRNAQLYREAQRELAERRRVEEEIRQRNEELTALNATAAAVSSSLNLQEVLTQALDKALAVSGVEIGSIYLLDQQTKDSVLAIHRGVSKKFADQVRILKIGESLTGWVAQSGESIVVDDINQAPAVMTKVTTTLVSGEGMRSIVTVPLKAGEKVHGVMHIASRKPRHFSSEEVRLYTAIAYQIGVAIENARMYEIAQQEIAERLQAEKALRESEERYRHIFEHFPIGIGISSPDGEVINANEAMQAITGYSLEEFKKINLASTYERIEDRQALHEAVKRYGSVVDFPVRLKRKDGTPYDALLSVSRINLGGKDFYHTICQDITERKRAAEALRRRAEEMAALQATVLGITAPHNLPTLLQTIVEQAARLLDAPSGGMFLCDPHRGEVRCVVSYNTRRDFTGTVFKYGEGAAGTVAQTGEPLIIDDYRAWSGRAAIFEEEQPFAAVLSVPMIWQGQVTGVIHVLRDMESRRFTEADLELLLLFANHAAIAVENAHLYAHSEELAISKERNRIAREIHDDLIQRLASLLMRVDLCLELIDEEPEEAKREVDKIGVALQDSIQEARRLIFALRPLALEQLGFRRALCTYIDDFAHQNEISVHLSLPEEGFRLPAKMEYALFRIVQEALNNVRWHAQADTVWIDLGLRPPDRIWLEIRDNGRGFDLAKRGPDISGDDSGGMGLLHMRERVEAMSGSFRVETVPTAGTKITVTLPLER